ncbi:GNAT family N-acetyltransferase [Arthrobacter sp. ISL-65]|uniref:GNAT family N-acetyltransferase n=1 Tax=Arthrobacter sp. ISL-65 TaxID=2819112 RepID=UPI001BE8C4C2|nr:GNAT family N-acetyltransferase [Arthrobacter sp. ISL-65]MBT2551393.1 GNAT family N-acetyltransferase [Arthrobacter sp. ISL-65]
MASNGPKLVVRFNVDDASLSQLHADAFGAPSRMTPWRERLELHSVSWVGAFEGEQLVGFVHAVWDGGSHAFLLDTAVAPGYQSQGIGTAIVKSLIEDIAKRGLSVGGRIVG